MEFHTTRLVIRRLVCFTPALDLRPLAPRYARRTPSSSHSSSRHHSLVTRRTPSFRGSSRNGTPSFRGSSRTPSFRGSDRISSAFWSVPPFLSFQLFENTATPPYEMIHSSLLIPVPRIHSSPIPLQYQHYTPPTRMVLTQGLTFSVIFSANSTWGLAEGGRFCFGFRLDSCFGFQSLQLLHLHADLAVDSADELLIYTRLLVGGVLEAWEN